MVRCMRPPEAAEYARSTTSTLAKRRMLGLPPRYSKPSPNVVIYTDVDLDEWMESSRRTSTSDEGARAANVGSGRRGRQRRRREPCPDAAVE
ncbi:MAG: DNA-binding protein [Rhodospirillales bacterium]|nr:DNA-binding protein [Rhodospirillales bacterium]